MKLDDKDLAIIQELKKDSRKSIRDISKITKIRPSTIHVRINQLVTNGVIEKFTLKLNNKAFGEDFIVFILVKTKYDIKKVVFENSFVKEVFGVTGEFDLMMKCKFKDINQFHDFLLKFRKENNVDSTVTMVSTIMIKEEV
jgi:DNA-binding Lrp family transcriptional regulator